MYIITVVFFSLLFCIYAKIFTYSTSSANRHTQIHMYNKHTHTHMRTIHKGTTKFKICTMQTRPSQTKISCVCCVHSFRLTLGVFSAHFVALAVVVDFLCACVIFRYYVIFVWLSCFDYVFVDAFIFSKFRFPLKSKK